MDSPVAGSVDNGSTDLNQSWFISKPIQWRNTFNDITFPPVNNNVGIIPSENITVDHIDTNRMTKSNITNIITFIEKYNPPGDDIISLHTQVFHNKNYVKGKGYCLFPRYEAQYATISDGVTHHKWLKTHDNRHFCPEEKIFDAICDVHEAVGHKRVGITTYQIKTMYSNITKK